jgi:fyn-related kinase
MSREEFLNEAMIMKRFHHKNLVQLYGVCSVGEPVIIVTELMVNGSLLLYLTKGNGRILPEKVLIDMGAQIAAGMAYLETNNFIHRDLAARNILVGYNNQVKIADFGLARFTQEENEYEAREGTRYPIKWTAPEAALSGKFSIKSDVWSFGVVLSEIITSGRTPYPGMSNAETLQEVNGGYRMPCPSKCPKPLYDIMIDCWLKNPMNRPTFESLQWRLDEFYTNLGSEYREAEEATRN